MRDLRAVSPFGDAAIEVAASSAEDARRLARRLSLLEGVLECVVGWDRVLVHLRDGVSPASRIDAVRAEIAAPPSHEDAIALSTRTHVVRVVYDGPDLREIAEATSLTCEEVARRHAAPRYVVEVIGFLPGFAYLGGVDPTIARPRRATPRPRVEPLSVAIAGPRSAIYPLASPGGWNLIGRALDVVPFDARRTPASLFEVGDEVRFEIAEVRA